MADRDIVQERKEIRAELLFRLSQKAFQYSELRFGQFLEVVLHFSRTKADLFYVEDSVLLQALKDFDKARCHLCDGVMSQRLVDSALYGAAPHYRDYCSNCEGN